MINPKLMDAATDTCTSTQVLVLYGLSRILISLSWI